MVSINVVSKALKFTSSTMSAYYYASTAAKCGIHPDVLKNVYKLGGDSTKLMFNTLRANGKEYSMSLLTAVGKVAKGAVHELAHVKRGAKSLATSAKLALDEPICCIKRGAKEIGYSIFGVERPPVIVEYSTRTLLPPDAPGILRPLAERYNLAINYSRNPLDFVSPQEMVQRLSALRKELSGVTLGSSYAAQLKSDIAAGEKVLAVMCN